MTPLSDRALRATRSLISTTHLASHPAIARAFDLDRHSIDLEILDDWPWSSGERVLVAMLRTFATSHGGPAISDLFALDRESRCAALAALGVFFSDEVEAWV